MKRKLSDRIIPESQAVKEMRRIGTMPQGIRIMKGKAKFRLIRLTKIKAPLANIIKEDMLSAGGDAAVHKFCCACKVPDTDVLLMGTVAQYQHLMEKLRLQPYGGKVTALKIRKMLAPLS